MSSCEVVSATLFKCKRKVLGPAMLQHRDKNLIRSSQVLAFDIRICHNLAGAICMPQSELFCISEDRCSQPWWVKKLRQQVSWKQSWQGIMQREATYSMSNVDGSLTQTAHQRWKGVVGLCGASLCILFHASVHLASQVLFGHYLI